MDSKLVYDHKLNRLKRVVSDVVTENEIKP